MSLQRVNIIGASGTGKTTLGRALSQILKAPFFDSDDYYQAPTDPPYQQQRTPEERTRLLASDLSLSRLREREARRFGSRLQPGGDMQETRREFMEWAAGCDRQEDLSTTRARHEAYLKILTCPVLRLERPLSTAEQLQSVLNLLEK